MNKQVPAPLRMFADRLAHDLQTRFPTVTVVWSIENDGLWTCTVEDGWNSWGSLGTDWIEADEVLPSKEIENLVATLTEQVVDNLWPDDATDPWPVCPTHGDHPLHPGLSGRLASWLCQRDPRIRIRIGSLD